MCTNSRWDAITRAVTRSKSCTKNPANDVLPQTASAQTLGEFSDDIAASNPNTIAESRLSISYPHEESLDRPALQVEHPRPNFTGSCGDTTFDHSRQMAQATVSTSDKPSDKLHAVVLMNGCGRNRFGKRGEYSATNKQTAAKLMGSTKLLVFTMCYGSMTCASFAKHFLCGNFVPRVISLWCVTFDSLREVEELLQKIWKLAKDTVVHLRCCRIGTEESKAKPVPPFDSLPDRLIVEPGDVDSVFGPLKFSWGGPEGTCEEFCNSLHRRACKEGCKTQPASVKECRTLELLHPRALPNFPDRLVYLTTIGPSGARITGYHTWDKKTLKELDDMHTAIEEQQSKRQNERPPKRQKA
jgi:hypothetical protein